MLKKERFNWSIAMSQSSSLVIPIVLWGKEAPTHVITAMAVAPELRSIVTGCNDGQIIIWDVRQLQGKHRHSEVPSPIPSSDDQTNRIIEEQDNNTVNNNPQDPSSQLCDQTCFEVRRKSLIGQFGKKSG